MSELSAAPRIFISVAEQSADEHAAALVRAFREKFPGARFAGLAGPALRAEGVECFFDMTARSAMGIQAFKKIPEAWLLLRRLGRYFDRERFDAAVVIDSPALNLPIAKLLKRRKIPVLYFIAPQTWAWGPPRWRNARIRRRVDRLACIWPFEAPYFQSAGIEATYVGHPSWDRLTQVQVDEARVAELRGGASPVVTILPGSRRHVLREVLPGQLEVARSIRGRCPRLGVLIAAASDEIKTLIESELKRPGRRVEARVVTGATDRAAAIRAADLCLVASGTISLEVAYWGTPMIIMYNHSKWGYRLIGRWLIRTPYLSIPNILAGREIVPEFMPYYDSTAPITARATEWLTNPTVLARIRAELEALIQPIVKPGAAANAAGELAVLLAEPGLR